jgi:hypothetical protein
VPLLRLPQFGKKRLRVLQIPTSEAFGKPAVNRGKQLIRVCAFALALPQPTQAGCCAQLPGFRLLAAGPVERGEKVPLGTFSVALEREHPTLDAQDLSVMKPFPPAGALDLCDLLVYRLQGIFEVASQCHAFCQKRFQDGAAKLATRRVPKRQTCLPG